MTSVDGRALQALSAGQDVTLTYNDKGQLVDRGETAGADKIMSLLVNDGLHSRQVGAQSERPAGQHLQRVHVPDGHHLLSHAACHYDRDLPEDVVVDGKVVQLAGTYDFVNEGKYWTGFDRTNPIEGAAREKVWTGTALALSGELGVGSATASALTMGFGIAALFALIGLTVVLTGLGLVWATRAATEKVRARDFKPVANPS
jgi:hypothetical protein